MSEFRAGQEDLVRRFDASLADLRDTRDDVIKLKQGYDGLRSDMIEMRQSVDRLVNRFEETRRTNWPLIAVLAGMLPVLLAGSGFIMSSYTANAVSPINSAIAELKTEQETLAAGLHDQEAAQRTADREAIQLGQQVTETVTAVKTLTEAMETIQQRTAGSIEADSQSRTDRAQLNTRLAKLETLLATETGDRREDSASFRTHLGEIETQFHAVSDVANLRGAQQERINALLWEKTYGAGYPNSTFFPPSIFQPDGQVK